MSPTTATPLAPRTPCALVSARAYAARRPETTVLYPLVREHLQTMLAQARDDSSHGFGLPRFVQDEFLRYLDCGMRAAGGFVRLRCDACGHERLLAFSCKGRAVCPSCTTRRMHDVAVHLCGRVLPHVPYRQWVLSLPRHVRFRLARDPALVSAVLAVFLRSVFAWQRRRARAAGVARPLCGSITFVQRFGSALNLNVHFHARLPDGVFSVDADGALDCHELAAPTDEDLLALTHKIIRRVDKLVARASDAEDDPVGTDALAPAQAASVQIRVAAALKPPAPWPSERCAFVRGFSLHANVHVPARDRQGLERLCRYGARPPLAQSRLERRDDGTLLLHLKRPRRSGAARLSFTPLELLGRLGVLVPPPRANLTRDHGIFAAHAKARALVVPPPPGDPPEPPAADEPAAATARAPSYRVPWAELLAKVFRVDVLFCERCGGRLRVLAYLTDPPVVRAILEHLGLPSTAPRAASARASPDPADAGPSEAFSDDPA